MESCENRERVLVSIHGMATEAPWQEAMAGIFNPHFRFVAHRYGDFRHPVLAVLWIALEIWTILAALVILGIFLGFGVLDRWQEWIIALLLCCAVFLYARVIAERRRDKIVNDLIDNIDQHVCNERDPHIIAHSLGSFMVGRMLEKHSSVSLGCIILTGCVLKPHYRWNIMNNRFEIVRNEVAGRDWVSSLASLLCLFIPEMGHAGRKGFAKNQNLVRDIEDNEYGEPWRPCVQGCICGFDNIDFPEACVLNLRCAKLTHNEMVRQRARRVWLPFLWGIPPKMHRQFVLQCMKCAELERKNPKAHSDAVKELRTKCWFWTKGTLEDYVRNGLRNRLKTKPSKADVTIAIRNLYQVVERAARFDASPKQQQYLYPEIAWGAVVEIISRS